MSQDYFGGSAALRPLYAGLALIEGLTLFIVFGMSGGVRASQTAVRMLVVGAAAAAAFNVDKLLMVLARTGSARQVANVVMNVRITMTTTDPNAAGSYFAMALLPAVGMIRSEPAIGVVVTLLIGAGELLAGSRTAFGAIAIIAVVIALFKAASARGARRAIILSAVAALAIAAIPAWSYLAHRSTSSTADNALQYRLGMWQKAIGMTRDHPLLGIGIGEFVPNSVTYPPINFRFTVPENAHNQFLQIMAELGVPGLAGFVAIAALSLLHRYDDQLTASMAVGVSVLLLTAIGGHPLLISTVAYPFWAALAVCNSGTLRAQAPRGLAIATCAAAVALAAAIPARADAVLDHAYLEHVGLGVSAWITDGSGSEYRVAAACASLYVPTEARRIEMAMRPHSVTDASLKVELREDGRLLNRVDLQGGQWTTVVFIGGMPDARERRFGPIELRVSRNGSAVPCDAQLVDVRKIVWMR
ncbi:MAG: O-antigen ligase family protein [Vicinamibacterales bacterium]